MFNLKIQVQSYQQISSINSKRILKGFKHHIRDLKINHNLDIPILMEAKVKQNRYKTITIPNYVKILSKCLYGGIWLLCN